MPRKKTPPVDPDNPPPTEIATEDILIPRPDLGPGAHTLIARKGDPIPTDWVLADGDARDQLDATRIQL